MPTVPANDESSVVSVESITNGTFIVGATPPDARVEGIEFSRARGSPENARAQGAASARLSNGGRSREAVGACTGGVLTALLLTSCEGLALHGSRSSWTPMLSTHRGCMGR